MTTRIRACADTRPEEAGRAIPGLAASAVLHALGDDCARRMGDAVTLPPQ